MRLVLASEDDIEVVGEAGNGPDAVTEASRTRPDVAIIDSGLPNGDGIHAMKRIFERVPGCRVVLVSGEEDPQLLVRAFEAGAGAFVAKSSPITELIEAARAIHRGEALVPARMLAGLLASLIRRGREHDSALRYLSDLTRREREVLGLLAQGADNDGIAQRLVISPATARTHVQNTLGKLGVHSRLEAASFVNRNGLLPELAPVEM